MSRLAGGSTAAAALVIVGVLLATGSSPAWQAAPPVNTTEPVDATQLYTALEIERAEGDRGLSVLETQKLGTLKARYVPAVDLRTAIAAAQLGQDREIVVGGKGRVCLVTFVADGPAGFMCQRLGPGADPYLPGGGYGELDGGGYLFRGLAPDGVKRITLETVDNTQIPLSATNNVVLAKVDARPRRIYWTAPSGEVRSTQLPTAEDEAH